MTSNNQSRRIRAAIAAAFVTLGSADVAIAGSSIQRATILQLHIRKSIGDIVFIRLHALPTGTPSCATNGYWHYTLPLGTPTDSKIYASLLAAFTAQVPVTFSGLGSCNEFGTIESADSILLET